MQKKYKVSEKEGNLIKSKLKSNEKKDITKLIIKNKEEKIMSVLEKLKN